MISEQLVLEAKGISKQFYKIPENKLSSKLGWRSLVESLLSSKTKSYHPQYFNALSEVSFLLRKGESLGIIGLNGSGKSTLLQIISGTMQPTQGTVTLNGRVAALLELGSGFNPEFTGIENIKLSASLHGLSKTEVSSKLESIVQFADIGDFIYQAVKTYSTGMSLRLAFSVAVHIDADILIIDEALAVGDARFQLKCFSFLEDFKEKGGSLILVSHELNSIARLCSNSILLHKGLIKAIGKPIDVINEYSKILCLINGEISKKENPPKISKRKQMLDAESSTSKEFSYGGQKAVIKKIKLLNSKCLETNILHSGEEFSIIFQICTKEKISKPIYALTIKDTKGQQIYGQNTHFAKKATKNLKKDQKVTVKFKQSCNLSAGDYFISIGMTRFENESLQVIHRRYDVLEIKVICTDGSFGSANCFSEIEILDA